VKAHVEASLQSKFLLNGFRMLPNFRCQLLALQNCAIEPNRTTGREHLDTVQVSDHLHHVDFTECIAGKQLGPIQNFGTPDIGRIQ